MAYQSGLLSDFWTGYEQRKATGGRPLTRREFQNLLGPIMDYNLRREELAQDRARQQSNWEREFGLREQAQKAQERASAISGAVQLPLAYGVAKQTGLLPQGFNLLNPMSWGGAANAQVAGTTANMFNPLATIGEGTLPGSPALGQVGPMSVAGAAPATTSLLGTVGPPALGFGVGSLASEFLGANKEISRTMKGAGIGAGIGSVVPGVGTLLGGAIGGAVGFISSLF